MEKNIIYLGDIHGNFTQLRAYINRLNISDTTIIQVGDFGIGFTTKKNDEEILFELNKFLESKTIIMLAIRGNHDDPFYFNGDHMYSNLKLLPDYTVMDIEDEKHLFVGGAISIDRKYRIENDKVYDRMGVAKNSYWKDEVFVLNKKKLNKIKGIDVLITHTTPDWCFPVNYGSFPEIVRSFANDDPSLIFDLTMEREELGKFFSILSENNNIKHHFYGHFHNSHTVENEGCTHHLLGIFEFKQLK